MDKRTFLKLSSAFTMASLISPLKGWAQKEKLKNWAGNLEYSTSNVHFPKSLEEIQKTVKELKKVKALGTRHCFNDIADSTYNLISTKELNKVLSLDKN